MGSENPFLGGLTRLRRLEKIGPQIAQIGTEGGQEDQKRGYHEGHGVCAGGKQGMGGVQKGVIRAFV